MAGWVDTDRGAFSRYKSVWLLSTTQQLITRAGGRETKVTHSAWQTDRHTHTPIPKYLFAKMRRLCNTHVRVYWWWPERAEFNPWKHWKSFLNLFSVNKHIFCKYTHSSTRLLLIAKTVYFTLISYFPVYHMENRGQTTFPSPPTYTFIQIQTHSEFTCLICKHAGTFRAGLLLTFVTHMHTHRCTCTDTHKHSHTYSFIL